MKRHLNLMSVKARTRESIRRCTRLWSRILVVTLVVLFQFGIAEWWSHYGEEQRCDSLEAQYEPLRLLKVENTTYQKQIEALTQGERVPLALAVDTPLPVMLGMVGQVVASGDGQIFLEELQVEQDALAPFGKEKRSRTVVLEGVGVHSKAVTEFADALRSNIPFTSVTLGSTQAVDIKEKIRQAFTIECTF